MYWTARYGPVAARTALKVHQVLAEEREPQVRLAAGPAPVAVAPPKTNLGCPEGAAAMAPEMWFPVQPENRVPLAPAFLLQLVVKEEPGGKSTFSAAAWVLEPKVSRLVLP